MRTATLLPTSGSRQDRLVKLLRQSTVSLTMSELTQAIYGTTDEYDKRALRTMVHHLRKRGIEITSLWHHEGPAHVPDEREAGGRGQHAVPVDPRGRFRIGRHAAQWADHCCECAE